jgi:uncharacterized membrane protein
MPYVLACVSAVLYGAGDFFGGFATRRASAITVTLASQAVGLVALLVAAPIAQVAQIAQGGHAAPPPAVDLAWGAGAGLAGGIGVALLYYALAVGVVSIVAPITAVCAMAIPVLVAIGLGERPHALGLIGIALAGLAVVLLSRGHGPTPGERAVAPSRSIAVALASGAAIGVFLVCLGRTREVAGLWPLLVARVVSVGGFLALALVLRAPIVPGRGARASTLAAGSFDVVANAVYTVAVRGGPLGLVATLASLYPASTVALARVVLGERLGGVARLGFVLALIAIVLITAPIR